MEEDAAGAAEEAAVSAEGAHPGDGNALYDADAGGVAMEWEE